MTDGSRDDVLAALYEDRDELIDALGAALVFADEGWSFASRYFKNKREFKRRRSTLVRTFDAHRSHQGFELVEAHPESRLRVWRR